MAKEYYELIIERMTDKQVSKRYTTETRKLKTLNRWRLTGSQGKRPCGYPDIAMMNACKQELVRRGLSVPQVDL
jgi:hypothetical protein